MTEANLVIQTAFLGDLILSVPVLKRIKKNDPRRLLIVVCKKGLGEFLLKDKIVDLAVEVEKSNSKSYEEALKQISQFEVNNLFGIHRSIRSLMFVARVKAKRKIGYSSFATFWVYDDLVEFVPEYPDVLRQFKILETVDADVRAEFLKEDFASLNDPANSIPEFFAYEKPQFSPSREKKIALFPGSVWATKKWTQEGYMRVAELLLEQGYGVDLLGGENEKEICNEIAAKVSGVNVLAGSYSIAQTIENLKKYALVICNDSAPGHMAAYDNTPVLSIFGPTTLALGFRPWSDNSAIVQNTDLSCRPCGKHGHQKCPLGHHNCMKLITPEAVYSTAMQLLRKNLLR